MDGRKAARTEWHASRRGLSRALRALDTDLGDLSDAPVAHQAVAALLAWHLSTTSGARITPRVAGTLVDDVRREVDAHGWTGHVALCGDGEHARVWSGGLPSAPAEACTQTLHLYELADLHAMALAVFGAAT